MHGGVTIVRHMVDVHNVNVQWSALQLEQYLNDTPLGQNPNFYIDGLALSHGFLLFKKDLARRGINVIEIFQEEKFVPCYHNMKWCRMSIEIKFTAYHTPHPLELDLLRNEILRKNKYEPSPYSSPSLVFGVMHIKRTKTHVTRDVETNTRATSANLRKSPSDLTERSIKNVTEKVVTSVEGVVGVKDSLYFLKSAVKILDFKQRKLNSVEVEEERGNNSRNYKSR